MTPHSIAMTTTETPLNPVERAHTRKMAAHFLRLVADQIEQGNPVLLYDKWEAALDFAYEAEPKLAPPTPSDLTLQLLTSANDLPIIAEGLHRADNRLRNIPLDSLEIVPERKPFFHERAAMALRLCDLPTVDRLPVAIQRGVVQLICAEHRREDVEDLINDRDTPGALDLELQIGEVGLAAVLQVLKGVDVPKVSPKVIEFPTGGAA